MDTVKPDSTESPDAAEVLRPEPFLDADGVEEFKRLVQTLDRGGFLLDLDVTHSLPASLLAQASAKAAKNPSAMTTADRSLMLRCWRELREGKRGGRRPGRPSKQNQFDMFNK